MFTDLDTKKILISFLIIFKCENQICANVLNGVEVIQVPGGEDAVLTCKSNADKNHNFWYWTLVDKNLIIGPENKHDEVKFKFSVVSGNLTIRGITSKDVGLYSCVSKGIYDNNIQIKSTKVVLQNDWKEVYEDNTTVNIYRVLIIFATLLFISCIGYFAYKMWKDRYRYPHYLEARDMDEDEESGEELFSIPGTSGTSPTSRNSKIVLENPSIPFDSGVRTDFISILDEANDK